MAHQQVAAMRPVKRATGGGVEQLNAAGTNLPEIRRIGNQRTAAGNDWIGLRERDAYAVRSSTSQPLRWCNTQSQAAAVLNASTGKPLARASSVTFPKVSVRLGNSSRSADA